MKRLKKVLLLTLTLFMLVSPILNVYSVSTNERQIVSSGGDTTQDGVTVSKMISASSLENYFDITLKVKTREIAQEEDIAIVIVMDVSNTMMESNGDKTTTTKLRAAMNAGADFINQFRSFSESSSATMKIGYVAFNSHGHEIFNLQTVKTKTQSDNLIKTMQDKTKAIVKNIDEKSTYDSEQENKYTNIEAGIKMADDMLYSKENASIKNKYVIFLSDGFPTTYIKSGYTGYLNRTPNATSANHSQDGMFYDEINGAPVAIGADYSDKGALRAEQAATRLKNKGTIIYSVGTGLVEWKTVDYYGDLYDGRHYTENGVDKGEFSTVDRTSKNYVIGKTVSDFKKWLGGTGKASNPGIGSGYSNHYFDVNDTNGLKNAYSKIFETIKEASKASWVTKDPMNAIQDEALKNIIGFVGIYNKNGVLSDSVAKGSSSDNTASFNATTDSITWDLKKSAYKTSQETVNGATITYYEYELKYRVRLETETKNFVEEKVYNTNGVTKLSYIYRVTGQTPVSKEIEFKIPSVKGYLGSLEFTKKSSYDGNVLSGTTFEIVHASDCECLDERSHMASNYKMTAVSDESGKVSFTSIPSGHKYVLHEVETDSYHELDTTNYNFEVSYGVTSLSLENNEFINTVKTNKLTLEKVVEGNNTKKEFTFELVGVYKESDLNGTFKATLNGEDTTVTFTDGKAEVKLKNKDKIIMDVPYNATINVEEVNSNGYIVKYKLNDNEFIYGNTLDDVKMDGDVSVNFTNVSSYKLPATGSSWNLILIIIGTALLVIPVIYIIKNSFKKADN